MYARACPANGHLDKIMEDEVFGPILPILTYKSLDEAFARIAATPHPLAGFVFSRDQKTNNRFIGELSYGGVNLVNVHLFVETMPFGGTGEKCIQQKADWIGLFPDRKLREGHTFAAARTGS